MTYDEKVQSVIANLEGGYDSEQEWGETILKGIGIERHFDADDVLTWVAKHVAVFRPCLISAFLEYVGDDGEKHELTWMSKTSNPDVRSMFIGCVEMAKGQEESRKRLKDAAEKRRSHP